MRRAVRPALITPQLGQVRPAPAFPDLPGSFIDIRVDQLADLRAALARMPGADVERFRLARRIEGIEFALIAASHHPGSTRWSPTRRRTGVEG